MSRAAVSGVNPLGKDEGQAAVGCEGEDIEFAQILHRVGLWEPGFEEVAEHPGGADKGSRA